MELKSHPTASGRKISLITVCNTLYIIALILTFILLFVSVSTDHNIPETDVKTFSEDWYYDSMLTHRADLKHPNLHPGYSAGTPIDYYASVPAGISDNCGMMFKAKNCAVRVYVGNETAPRASFQLYGDLYGKSSGTDWVEFSLQADDAEKLIHIEFIPYYNDSSCYLGSFTIGKFRDVITGTISGQLSGAVIGILMFFVGIFLLIIFLALKKSAGINEMDLLYLGFTAIAGAGWIFSDTKLMQFLTHNTGAIHNFNCMMLMLIPLPVLLLFQKAANRKQRILISTVAGITVLNIIISCVLHFTGISDFHENLKLTHITIILASAAILYSNISYCLHEKQTERRDKIAAIGLIIVVISGIIDVIRYKGGGTNDSSRFTRIAIFLYILALGITSLEHAMQMVKKGMTADLVSRLAYEDGLTGLGNRTAYKELLSSIAENNHRHCVFMFDINNLKYVNDNIGHAAGDQLITSATGMIRKHFESIGRCYRIGGDEFICISDQPENTSEILSAFFREVDKYNQQHKSEFPLVIAAGAARCEKNEDIYHAVETADKRMYECKTNLKIKYPLEKLLKTAGLQAET